MIFKDQEQIVEEMLADFAAQIENANVSDASDIAIKTKVLAAQINSLYYNQQWLKRQMFPQTADEEYLDYHAAEKGITRKAAVKSTGILTFSRTTPDTVDRPIPKGSENSTLADKDGNTVKVITTADAVLPAGQLSIDVPAEAVEAGESGNVAANAIVVMSVPPAGIESVTNPQAFTGGAAEETDDELRERYLYACANPQNGGTKADYEQWALSVSGVTSALCIPLSRGNGTVDVVIAGSGGIPSDELVADVQAVIDVKRPIGADARVIKPTQVTIDVIVQVEVSSGYQLNDVRADIEDAIRVYIDSVGLGEKVVLTALGNAIFTVDGVTDYVISSPSANVQLAATEQAVVGIITIS